MMASKAVNSTLLRNLAIRSYSAAAAQCKPGGAAKQAPKFSCATLPNKLVVTSLETDSPLTRVSIAFRAGSRFECGDNLGASHIMRIVAGLSTEDASELAITRNLQMVGANLSASSDREVIIYTLEGTRDAVHKSMEYLQAVATKQKFQPWEISDNMHRVKYELAGLSEPLQAVDLLHRAAFRRGLGNSLFCPPYNVGQISTETLQDYVAKTFTANRAAVAGWGISQESLVTFATDLGLPTGEGVQNTSTYQGGEIRKQTGGCMAHVAIGTKGACLTNAKEALAFAVLQRALGTGFSLKYAGSSTPLFQTALAAAGDNPFAISALNVEYSDTGLFGFVASAPSEVIGKLVTDAVTCIRAGKLEEKDVTRGKNQLKVALLAAVESGYDYVENMAAQAVLTGAAQPAEDIAKTIDSITLPDVAAALKQVQSTPLSLATVGDTIEVPYLDSFK